MKTLFSPETGLEATQPPRQVVSMPSTRNCPADLDTAPGIDRLEWLSDPDDPRFKRAMRNTCEICEAKPGRPCWNTINSADPLPGRLIHHARLRPKGRGKEAKDDE